MKNPAAFSARYPGVAMTDTFGGSLSNGAEQVILSGADGSEIRNFTYSDQFPWPTSADGDGYSLVLACPGANPDHNDTASWQPASGIHGTPGYAGGQSYADWAIAEGIIGAPGDDDDLDGFANLFGYAIAAQPAIGIVGNQFRVTVDQNLWASGVLLEVQISDDLKEWTALVPMAASHNGDGTRTLTYLGAGADITTRQFTRLKVTQK
ncbi:hypothetical protein N9A70_05155 [Akkermansiaceae bacterium]|nr:hypothetical protein [Akkermansiaceae bacterium]MDA7896286.1 hypothetical protein [bacterium]MDB4382628.1 hypothetical protein [Akkermansiaceae bacterium]MDB4465492.1 hypothetical protein [Akkermansiaceae bacterium]